VSDDIVGRWRIRVSDDIVERLRNGPVMPETCLEAANEIERLRKEVESTFKEACTYYRLYQDIEKKYDKAVRDERL